MPVERTVLDEETMRERPHVHVTFGGDANEEMAAAKEIIHNSISPGLEEYTSRVKAAMVEEKWPDCSGWYWFSQDNYSKRWKPVENEEIPPEWARRFPVVHPCEIYSERTPERDMYEILKHCEWLHSQIASNAPASKLVDLAIQLGRLVQRFALEQKFDRAVKAGIGTRTGGHKGGKAKRDADPEKQAGKAMAIDEAEKELANGWSKGKSALARALVKRLGLKQASSTVRDWLKPL